MTIEVTYRERTPGSAAVGPRAEKVMPAGDTRAAGYHPPYPLTIVRGAGPKLIDVDGNEYWDLAGNYTSLVHGNAYPPIVEAAERAIRDGSAWPARNRYQVELAELLCERVRSVEHVRFCNSGTEAGLAAQVAARLHTGRPKILMARYGYHGSHEIFDAGFHGGSSDIPGAVDACVAEFGDAKSFEACLDDDVAAVFLEGVMGASGVVSAPAEFYRRVRDAAHRAGALFVLDEVITLRLATGGFQSVVDVEPDLTMFGKLIGGGLPVGGVGGRTDVMAVMDPRTGAMFHSGTFHGNPVTMAAGVASVRELTAERITTMALLAARLEDGLRGAARSAALPLSVRRVGSLLNVYFMDAVPANNAARTDSELMSAYHLAGMNHGLYFASRGLLALSTVIDASGIDEIIGRSSLAMTDVAQERGECT